MAEPKWERIQTELATGFEDILTERIQTELATGFEDILTDRLQVQGGYLYRVIIAAPLTSRSVAVVFVPSGVEGRG